MVLLYFIFIVILPTVALGLIARVLILRSLQEDYSASMEQAVQQVTQNLAFRRSEYEFLIDRVSMDQGLISILSAQYKGMQGQWRALQQIYSDFGDLQNQPALGIQEFRIYDDNPTLVQDDGILWKPNGRDLAGVSENVWYREMSHTFMKWGYSKQDGALTLSSSINDPAGTYVGAVFMELNYDLAFGNAMNDVFGKNSSVTLISNTGMVLASSDPGLIGHVARFTVLHPLISMDASFPTLTTFKGERYMMVNDNAGYNWKVIELVPLSDLERETSTTSMWIIVITVSLTILSLVLIWAVVTKIVSRLRDLQAKMSSITVGEFDVRVTPRYHDELGGLEFQFNQMADRLGTLVRDVSTARLREKEEAFRALQAQINPHLLYNSLGLIRWRALDTGDTITCDIIERLSTFYRLALSSRDNVVRIEEEIRHVRSFVDLQQYRYPDSVIVKWELDREVGEFYTVRLILQPLVENAYWHGQLSNGQNGRLRIAAYRLKQTVVFEVEDNGVGLSLDELTSIRSGIVTSSDGGGIGLRNIKDRLGLYFQGRASLTIESEPGIATLVRVTIPLCSQPPTIEGGTSFADTSGDS